MARGAALVDSLREVAHLRDAVGDLVPEEHPAAAGLGALADHDLDRVGLAQVVRVHPVAGREELVDQDLRVLAFLGRHAAVAGGRRRAHLRRAAAECLLRRRRESTEAHAGDRHRDPQLQRLLGEARPERDVRVAALPVTLEGIAGDARAEQQEIVEVGDTSLRAKAADVVDALLSRALDLRDHRAVVEVRLAKTPGTAVALGHQ
jgi:hypothetical protein